MRTPGQIEECLVASILDNPQGKWGPNLCKAVAYARDWTNPVASALAIGISKCLFAPNRENLMAKVSPEHALWLMHPTFMSGNALSLELAEVDAGLILPGLAVKQLERYLKEAAAGLRAAPESWRQVANRLRRELEAIV